jgi:hypothetical protein
LEELPLEGAEGVPADVCAPLDPDGSRGARNEDVRLRPVEELADHLDVFYCASQTAISIGRTSTSARSYESVGPPPPPALKVAK